MNKTIEMLNAEIDNCNRRLDDLEISYVGRRQQLYERRDELIDERALLRLYTPKPGVGYILRTLWKFIFGGRL